MPTPELDFHAPDHESGNRTAFGFGERKLVDCGDLRDSPQRDPPHRRPTGSLGSAVTLLLQALYGRKRPPPVCTRKGLC